MSEKDLKKNRGEEMDKKKKLEKQIRFYMLTLLTFSQQAVFMDFISFQSIWVNA